MPTWPNIFDPSAERWRLRGVTISGGISVAGTAPSARTDGGGLWVCEQRIPLPDTEHLKAARALVAALDGDLTPMNVPYFVGDTGPFPDGEWNAVVSLSSAAALRAAAITVTLTRAFPLEGGEVFSVDHATRGRRLYTVAEAGGASGGAQQIIIRPPLREAVPSGAALDFNTPSCRMKLTNPEEFAAGVDAGKLTEVPAIWVEAF